MQQRLGSPSRVAGATGRRGAEFNTAVAAGVNGAANGAVRGGSGYASRMSYESSHWRQRLHTVIFEADTRAGRAFDVSLIVCILASVAVVIAESIASVDARWHRELFAAEIAFTLLFTVEYILRLLAVRRPLAYACSLLGVIDLLAVAPTWLALVVPGAQFFLTVRVLRLLRIFRILKLTEYLTEAGVITSALRASRRKIFVFLFAVITLVEGVSFRHAIDHSCDGPSRESSAQRSSSSRISSRHPGTVSIRPSVARAARA